MRREREGEEGKHEVRDWEGSEQPASHAVISTGGGGGGQELTVTWAASASLQGADQLAGGQAHVAPAHSAWFPVRS